MSGRGSRRKPAISLTPASVTIVIGALVALGWLASCDKTPNPSEKPRLKAAAVERSGIIVFASEEPETMSSCDIDLNALESFGGGYSYHFGPVEPGGKRLIPAREFLSGSERFDPNARAVTSLIIVCQTTTGERNWGWQRR